jgi:hypothetical protein
MHKQFALACSAIALATVAVAVSRWDPPTIIPRMNNGYTVFIQDPRSEFDDPDWPVRAELSDGWRRIQAGVEHWHANEQSQAYEAWRFVAVDFEGTDLESAALANIGAAAIAHGKLHNAIAAYEAAIASVPEANNHYLCLDLSHAYLQINDPVNAIRCARLAQFDHPPCSMCGMADMLSYQIIDRYIASVNNAVDRRHSFRLQTSREWQRQF